MSIYSFVQERNAAFLSLERNRIEEFARKWGLPLPSNEEEFWHRVHKTICKIECPLDVKQKSIEWLSEHGSTQTTKS